MDYWVPGVRVTGVHEMVANALIMTGEKERETNLRGEPLPGKEGNVIMYNGGKIIAGLDRLSSACYIPFPTEYWKGQCKAEAEDRHPGFRMGQRDGKKQCVESKEFMRTEHMQLLNNWRDSVVRNGDRIYVSTAGQKHSR